MDWTDLLFMHWPVPAASLRPFIPAGLELDLHQGQAWVAVVPFRMSGVRARFLPELPGLSAFPELNVRTYVTRGGTPGVWFFSLDAASRIAVRGARQFFHLPYFDARIGFSRPARSGGPDEIRYRSHRTHRGAPDADLEVTYAPTGPAFRATAGSLDDWLTARYCFYAADGEGAILRATVHHKPWRLQPARAEIHRNAMTVQIGLELPAAPPLLLYSERTEVVGWMPERLG